MAVEGQHLTLAVKEAVEVDSLHLEEEVAALAVLRLQGLGALALSSRVEEVVEVEVLNPRSLLHLGLEIAVVEVVAGHLLVTLPLLVEVEVVLHCLVVVEGDQDLM